MKQLLWIYLPFILSSCNNKASDSVNLVNLDTIKHQALKMSESMMKRDAKSFIEFHYPKVIEMIGSKEKAIIGIIDSWKETDRDSIILIKNTIGSPTKVIRYRGELQCTIPQSFEYKSPNGRAIVKSTLIAISLDDGKKWYFIDVVGENVKKIKKVLPNLSNELIIPEQMPVEVIKD